MAWTLDEILGGIQSAGNKGITFADMEKKLRKKFKAQLPTTLEKLLHSGLIWGPLKKGQSKYYFQTGYGPSVETTVQTIFQLAKDAGVKLLSKAAFEDKITGFQGKFLADALRVSVSERILLKIICGKKSTYFLHREVAEEYFHLNGKKLGDEQPSDAKSDHALNMETVRPVYEKLKREQGGFGTIKIYDLLKALNVSKAVLHDFLLREAKAERLTIHPTTTVNYPSEIIEAGIRVEGHPDPLVTVVFKENL